MFMYKMYLRGLYLQSVFLYCSICEDLVFTSLSKLKTDASRVVSEDPTRFVFIIKTIKEFPADRLYLLDFTINDNIVYVTLL